MDLSLSLPTLRRTLLCLKFALDVEPRRSRRRSSHHNRHVRADDDDDDEESDENDANGLVSHGHDEIDGDEEEAGDDVDDHSTSSSTISNQSGRSVAAVRGTSQGRTSSTMHFALEESAIAIAKATMESLIQMAKNRNKNRRESIGSRRRTQTSPGTTGNASSSSSSSIGTTAVSPDALEQIMELPWKERYGLVQDLRDIFDGMMFTRRRDAYEFYSLWREWIWQLISDGIADNPIDVRDGSSNFGIDPTVPEGRTPSQLTPLQLFGWELLEDVIHASAVHRPPPRAYRVRGAGCDFVNGLYEYAGRITDDGYAYVEDKRFRRPRRRERTFPPGRGNDNDNDMPPSEIMYKRTAKVEVPLRVDEDDPTGSGQDHHHQEEEEERDIEGREQAQGGDDVDRANRNGSSHRVENNDSHIKNNESSSSLHTTTSVTVTKTLTLFQCIMQSKKKWWFLSDADEEQPGTDRDIDYYEQHHSSRRREHSRLLRREQRLQQQYQQQQQQWQRNGQFGITDTPSRRHTKHEYDDDDDDSPLAPFLPPTGGWRTSKDGIGPPPKRVTPVGAMVPPGQESNALEHQLARWMIQRDVLPLALRLSKQHPIIANHYLPLIIRFGAATMFEQELGREEGPQEEEEHGLLPRPANVPTTTKTNPGTQFILELAQWCLLQKDNKSSSSSRKVASMDRAATVQPIVGSTDVTKDPRVDAIATWLHSDVLADPTAAESKLYAKVLVQLGLDSVSSIVTDLRPEDVETIPEITTTFKFFHRRRLSNKLRENSANGIPSHHERRFGSSAVVTPTMT